MEANKQSFSANKVFYFIAILFSVFSAILVFLFIKSIPLVIAQAIYVCQQALSETTPTLPKQLPLLTTFFLFIALSLGGLTFVIQILKTRRYIKQNIQRKTIFSRKFHQVAKELKLRHKIQVIEDINKACFCYGLLNPKICLSTGLLKSLNKQELRSVLLHESYHLKNHDPLKIIIAKAASRMFFFIPLINEAQKHYVLLKEIAADQKAIKESDKRFLLSAFSKSLRGNVIKFKGVAALIQSDQLELRIKYLTGKRQKISFRPTLASLLLSLLSLTLVFKIINSPVYAMDDMNQMGKSYFVCPIGDQCAKECSNKLKEERVNYSVGSQKASESLYSPVDK